MRRRPGEQGYALVAAVASIAVFAGMALAVMSATQGALLSGRAEIAQAKVSAAADAGIALALSGLLSDDIAERWSLDGRVHTARFEEARLRMRVEDERGKVPLGQVDDATITRLLEAMGLSDDALAVARDSLLDWLDDDDVPRPRGAERAFYAGQGIRPRNGLPLSIEELRRIRGFDATLVARIAPVATIVVSRASFDPRYANPTAIGVMAEGGPAQEIARSRELAGQRVAIEIGDAAALVGRPVTIVAEASLPGGGYAARRMTIVPTGLQDGSYRVLSYK